MIGLLVVGGMVRAIAEALKEDSGYVDENVDAIKSLTDEKKAADEKKAWNEFERVVNAEQDKLNGMQNDSFSISGGIANGLKSYRYNTIGRPIGSVIGATVGGSMGMNGVLDAAANGDRTPCFRYKCTRASDELDALNDSLKTIVNLQLQIGAIKWESCSRVNINEFEQNLKMARDAVLSDGDKQRCDTMFKDVQDFSNALASQQPRIAATGVLKAGKSTMMNCLTGDFENWHFAVDIVRKTVKEQCFELDGYLFVDTPGLDANEQDSAAALNSLKTADVILFCHNINTGGPG